MPKLLIVQDSKDKNNFMVYRATDKGRAIRLICTLQDPLSIELLFGEEVYLKSLGVLEKYDLFIEMIDMTISLEMIDKEGGKCGGQ